MKTMNMDDITLEFTLQHMLNVSSPAAGTFFAGTLLWFLHFFLFTPLIYNQGKTFDL